MKKYTIHFLQILFILLIILVLAVFLTREKPKPETRETNIEKVAKEENFVSETEYKNSIYGFSFYLPDDWKGYSTIEDSWEGYSLASSEVNQDATETGPLITLRHPDWEYKSPKQDIPIMVFTLMQWRNLGEDKFHIGAAPIGPTEIGRNSRYVFAIPARYNYSFYDGYEEVEYLLQKNPLTTF